MRLIRLSMKLSFILFIIGLILPIYAQNIDSIRVQPKRIINEQVKKQDEINAASVSVYLEDVPSSITVGESFIIKARLKNSGSNSATDDIGYLDVSFPNDNPSVSIDSKHSWWDKVEKYRGGRDKIWHRYDYEFTANYDLISADDKFWASGDDLWVKIKVTPTRSGTLYIYYRGTIGSIIKPTSSSYKDQQDWPVYRKSITVKNPNSPPSKPSGPDPYNSKTNVSVDLALLNWSNSSDPDNDNVDYKVYFGTDSSPDEGEYRGNEGGSDWSIPSSLKPLQYDTYYYWKIIAYDGNGGETFGDVWKFKTQSPQYYTISGYVKSSRSDIDIIQGAVVKIDNRDDLRDETDGNGYYIINNVPGGNHTISVSHPAYTFPSGSTNKDLTGNALINFSGYCKGTADIDYVVPDYFEPGKPFDITVKLRNANYSISDVVAYLDVSFPDFTTTSPPVSTVSTSGFNTPLLYRPKGGPKIFAVDRSTKQWYEKDAGYLLVSAERTSTLYNNQWWTYTLRVTPPNIDEVTLYIKGNIGDSRTPTSGTLGQQYLYENVVKIPRIQYYTVTGYAKSSRSDIDVIPGAVVKIDNSDQLKATTDYEGKYTITNVPSGSHTISITHGSYTFPTSSYSISVTGNTSRDFSGYCKGTADIDYVVPDYFEPGKPFDITVKLRNANYSISDVVAYLDVSFPDFTTTSPPVSTVSTSGFNTPILYRPKGGSEKIYAVNRSTKQWYEKDPEYLLVSAERTTTLYNNQWWTYTLRVTPPNIDELKLHIKGNIGDSRNPTSGTLGQQYLYENVVKIPSRYNITLNPYRISNTAGTKNSSNPGNTDTSFFPGETVRVTLSATNTGYSIPVQTVLNIFNNSGNLVYDSHELDQNNSFDSPLDKDETDYYSFDWTIPFTAKPGSYKIGASVRDKNDFDKIFETTEPGSNTGFNDDSWIIANVFTVEPDSRPEIKIPILMYHNIADVPKSQYWVSTSNFQAQMDYLEAYGYNVITLKDIYNYKTNNTSLPAKPIVLTFDDGYENFYTEAYPILRQKGFKAISFLITDFIGTSSRLHNTWERDATEKSFNNPHLLWSEVLGMSNNGISFGAHTKAHPDLVELATSGNTSQLENEINGSKQNIVEKLGKCEFFSYPYGSVNGTVGLEVINSGYLAAVDIDRGKLYSTTNSEMFQMERVDISRDTDLNSFVQKIDPNYISPDIRISSVRFIHSDGSDNPSFNRGETVKIEVTAVCTNRNVNSIVSLNLDSDDSNETPPVYDSHITIPSSDTTVTFLPGVPETFSYTWKIPNDAALGQWYHNIGFHGENYLLWYGGSGWNSKIKINDPTGVIELPNDWVFLEGFGDPNSTEFDLFGKSYRVRYYWGSVPDISNPQGFSIEVIPIITELNFSNGEATESVLNDLSEMTLVLNYIYGKNGVGYMYIDDNIEYWEKQFDASDRLFEYFDPHNAQIASSLFFLSKVLFAVGGTLITGNPFTNISSAILAGSSLVLSLGSSTMDYLTSVTSYPDDKSMQLVLSAIGNLDENQRDQLENISGYLNYMNNRFYGLSNDLSNIKDLMLYPMSQAGQIHNAYQQFKAGVDPILTETSFGAQALRNSSSIMNAAVLKSGITLAGLAIYMNTTDISSTFTQIIYAGNIYASVMKIYAKQIKEDLLKIKDKTNFTSLEDYDLAISELRFKQAMFYKLRTQIISNLYYQGNHLNNLGIQGDLCIDDDDLASFKSQMESAYKVEKNNNYCIIDMQKVNEFLVQFYPDFLGEQLPPIQNIFDLQIKNLHYENIVVSDREEVSFSFEIVNIGAESNNIPINVFDNNALIYNFNSGLLEKGESKKFIFSWVATPGDHTLKVLINYNDDDLQNNTQEINLSIPSSPYLINPKITPSEGDVYTNFTFSCLFRSSDNQPPDDDEVYLYIDNVQVLLTHSTSNYLSGVSYYIDEYQLTSGNHLYYFVTNKDGDELRLPRNGAYEITVNEVNKNPILLWPGGNNYISDGLHPESGTTADNFTFRIKYSDADDDAPLADFPKLHLLKNGVEINGSPFNMVADNNVPFTSGRIYSKTISNLAEGTDYTYWFEAKDSNGAEATGEPTNTTSGPDISDPVNQVLAYWKMDEGSGANTVDETGNGYNGEVVSATWINGVSGNALAFDGSSDYVQVSNGVNMILDQEITVELYLFISSYPTNDMYLISNWSPGNVPGNGDAGTALAFLDGGAQLFFSVGYCYNSWNGSGLNAADIPLNQWNHIAGVRSADGIKIYLNGIEKKSAAVSSSAIHNPNQPIRIGAFPGGGQFFNGKLDEIRISNVALNPTEFLPLPDVAPVLAWAGESNYTVDGLHPETGTNVTEYTFKVKYSDNDAPSTEFPKLHIHKNGVEINSSPFSMVAGNNDSFTSGRIYSYSISNLSAGSDYTYYFEAKDTAGESATGNPTNITNGPIVNENIIPDLSILDLKLHLTRPVLTKGSSGEWDADFVKPGSVIFENGTYKIWYEGQSNNNRRIGYATSQDGIQWTKYENNPVYDDPNIIYESQPCVVKDVDGYKMYYMAAHSNSDYYPIRLATSLDGITWTKYSDTPVLDTNPEAYWEKLRLGVNSVFYNGTSYTMYYEGTPGNSGLSGGGIGLATSTDGINWTRNVNNPIIPHGGSGAFNEFQSQQPRVVMNGNQYQMLFMGLKDDGITRINLPGYAISADGLNWNLYEENPAILDGARIPFVGPIILDGDTYNMWFYLDSEIYFASTRQIEIISPNGGENWQAGSTQNITWSCSNIQNVKIEYSINNGADWNTIVASTSALAGSYPWDSIPNTPSTECKIRLSDIDNNIIFDESDAVFSILPSGDFVAYYNFLGNSNDLSGNGHHGTVYGASLTVDGNGNSNSAYQFDGENDYISIAHSTDFNFGTNGFTLEVELKTSIVPTGSWSAIFSKHNSAYWHDEEIFLYIEGTTGYPVLSLSDGNGYFENAKGTTNICDGDFHNIRGIRAGGKISIYVDGNLEGSTSASINPDNSNAINIGRSYYGNGHGYFSGVISELKLSISQNICDPGWNAVIYPQTTTVFGEVMIDGVPAQQGDIVGAFVNNECRGVETVVIDQDRAYVTLLVNGVIQGESISFKIYSVSECKEYIAANTLLSQPGNIVGSVGDYFPIEYLTDDVQSLQLKNGWNLISLYVHPENNSPSEIFAALIQANNLIQVKSEDKSFDPLVPPFLNTLTELENGKGYWIKLSNDAEIQISGSQIGLLSITLKTGWNLIGLPRKSGFGIGSLLSGIMQRIRQVKSISKSYDPSVPPFLNTLANIEPGYGYWIKVTEETELSFPINRPISGPSLSISNSGIEQRWTPMIYPNSTTAYLKLHGNCRKNDLIGAFVEGECRGISYVIDDNGKLYSTMVINGERIENITFKLFNYESEKEIISDNHLQSNPGEIVETELDFSSRYITDVAVYEDVPSTNKLYAAYPNPFNPSTTIMFDLSENGNVGIDIYTINGELVKNVLSQEMCTGTHTVVWDGLNELRRSCSSGIYIIRMNTNSYSDFKKIVLLR